MPLDVRPLTQTLGAEVGGVDLTSPLSIGEVDEIRRALLEHGVVFFRNQPLTPADQIRFCEYFGVQVEGSGSRDMDAAPGVSIVQLDAPKNNVTDRWHSDHMFMPHPPMATVLHCVETPPVGGDTCFTSMSAAFEDLHPAVQHMLEGFTAVHSAGSTRAIYKGQLTPPGDSPMSIHPMVQTHPESGRKVLYVAQAYTTRIVELDEIQSDGILRMLFAHLGRPEFQCRFRWEKDSVAMWDNRSVLHYAVPDYRERRVMHRAMIAAFDSEPAHEPAVSAS